MKYKLLTTLTTNEKEARDTSKAIKEIGYDCRVIKLKTGTYAVEILVTKDKHLAQMTRENIQNKLDILVALCTTDK